MSDQDETRTSDACASCPARCCSGKFGFYAIYLTHEEQENPLFKPHLTALGQLKLEGRHCRFLDVSTHRCKIYEQRPRACRGFVCHDMVHQGRNTLAMVYRDRSLRAHLESLGLLPPLEEDLYWAENAQRVPTPATTESNMYRPESFNAGTWRFFKLEAATGRVVLEGRRRSTSRHGEPASVIRQLLNEREEAKWKDATGTVLAELPSYDELPDRRHHEIKTENYHDIEIAAETC